MIEIVQAPNETTSTEGVKLFLAGGISNCPQWQKEISERLLNEQSLKDYSEKIIIFNPRCKDIPEERPQIMWEYDKLGKSDIISFWFSVGSLNPITLFEYGSHLKSKKAIVVGCHPDYERRNNVITQTKLAKPTLKVNEDFEEFYTQLVAAIIKKIKSKRKIK